MAPKTLQNDPVKRERRINELITRLEAKKHVQNRDIKAVLTPLQWNECSSALTDREAAEVPYPDALNSYFDRVEAADFQNIKNSTVAEGRYEDAQERLDEILNSATAQERSAIEYWLDRPVEYDPQTKKISIGLDPTSVPRKLGSRSQHANKLSTKMQSAQDQIREIKLGYLRAERNSLKKPNKKKQQANEAALNAVDALRKLVRR